MRFLFFLFIFSFLTGAEIQIGTAVLSVEIASTREMHAKGLMGRKNLPEGEGLLFVYSQPQWLGFWMKNTLIPLSVAFFDENQRIINIADMDPPKEGEPLITYPSEKPALYALEVPQGWFAKNNIKPGAKFSFLDSSNQVK